MIIVIFLLTGLAATTACGGSSDSAGDGADAGAAGSVAPTAPAQPLDDGDDLESPVDDPEPTEAMTGGPAEEAPGCGDGTCDDATEEDCRSCTADCGPCPPCYAPACATVGGAPPLGFDAASRWDLDLSIEAPAPPAQQSTDGGNLACGRPSIQIMLSRITVIDEVDDNANDEVYCIIQTEAATGAELRVTVPTEPLPVGGSKALSAAEGLVWGSEGPRDPGGNLRITYDCFESDASSGSYQALLDNLGDALGSGAQGSGNAWVAAAGAHCPKPRASR